jgi:predicted metal-dependent hydrolase
MLQKVVLFPKVGEVVLKKNSRSKRIKLYVKPNKQVIVSLPSFASYKSAENFVSEHIPWIQKQQSKLETGLTKHTTNSVYYTKYHLIKITEKNIEKEKATIKGDIATVFIPSGTDIESEPIQQFINFVITEVYRKEAKLFLPGRIEELAKQFGFKYNQVSVRNNKTNWGSCSGKNNISLNLNLMKLPDHLIDYIILHELAHTIVKNHSSNFYQVLNRVTDGKSRELSKEIKGYSAYTY